MNGCTVGDIQCALLEVASGTPELVVVDRRVLALLMGGLEPLIVLDTFERACGLEGVGATGRLGLGPAMDVEPFVWDQDELCP